MLNALAENLANMVVMVNRSWYSDGIYDIVEHANCKFVSSVHRNFMPAFATFFNLSCVGYDTVVISSPFYQFQAGIANVLSCVELYTVREFPSSNHLLCVKQHPTCATPWFRKHARKSLTSLHTWQQRDQLLLILIHRRN